MSETILEKEIYTEYRPWGNYSILEEEIGYKIKKLVINPKQRLSLQLHHHRDEQWIIVKGVAFLTVGSEIKPYSKGDSITILKGETHRIENRSDSSLIIIEVQNGEYLGEDDIVRIQDDYSRAS